MSPQNRQNVFARFGRGRADEIEKIYLHAVSGAESYALGVLGAPQAGTSEVLRRVFDRLFLEQRFVVPFYFSLSRRDGDARSAAARYVYELILQAVAFRRRDADLIAASPDICDLKSLAPLSDADWVTRLCEECNESGPLNDDRAFIRSALAAPMRAAAAGKFRVCVIVDDLHAAEDDSLLDELASLASSARVPVIFGSRRRSRHAVAFGRTVTIDPLELEQAAAVIDDVAVDAGVEIAEQPRDLLAVQTEGRLSHVHSLIAAARDRGVAIADYRTLQRLYGESLVSGAVGSYFDAAFARAVGDAETRRKLIDQLAAEATAEGAGFGLAALRDRIGIERAGLDRLVRALESEEILVVEGDRARLAGGTLIYDYLGTRRSTVSAPAATGELIANAMKRAPRLMSREYRRSAAVGLREILADFNLQEIPRALLDYRVFDERVRGGDEDEAVAALFADGEKITLPQIAHTAPLADYLPAFADVTEPERAVAARGFSSRAYTDDDEIAWLAAEIDSKLEADEDLAREWCDRLEAAARELGLRRFRIWLIAPEGFSRAALDHLAFRNAFGSSRRQAEILARRLSEAPAASGDGLKEYELTIPVGDQTELIAAHALEEISRRYDFPPRAVNQMKTALVEACINAAEHGLVPDGKIYQKFAVGSRKVVITVSNRGLRLADRIATGTADQSELGEGRRGWGLNLIRGLMDDVRVEPVEDGTRIVMTKIIPAK